MSELFADLSGSLSHGYFVRQLLVIMGIFALGFFVLLSSDNHAYTKRIAVKKCILAFPVGISAFSIAAYFILTVGIPYNTYTVTFLYLGAVIGFSIYLVKTKKLAGYFSGENVRTTIILLLVAALLALIACSGIIPVSISNDSMYYFHEYPRDIVYFGHLRDQFDTFLTDTGLGAASIETLPFLFGFNESFGIREFMHMCFIAFFSYAVYEKLNKIIPSLVLGGLCAVSSPVYILGHWAMANMYFMDIFFMAAFLAYEASGNVQKDNDLGDMITCAILTVMCALLRMEGGIFVLLLIGAYTFLRIKSRDLVLMITLPVLVLLVIYEIKIYCFYYIDNPYTFLTPQKAVLQAAVFVCMIIYLLLIRNLINAKFARLLPFAFIIVLAGANGVLLMYNKELYMGNLRAFYRNMLGQSGWGMLPQLTIMSVLILVVAFVINRRYVKSLDEFILSERFYFTILTVGFVLVTIAVSFMRGDILDVQVGDSGNRVMMQVAPLVIYTLILYFINLNEQFKND